MILARAHLPSAARMGRFAFGTIAIWMALAMLADAAGLSALHAALDTPFLLLCHRRPERVLAIAGVAMPLCSRCAGLWLGISVGAALAWPRIPIRALRWVLGGALSLLLIELVTQDLGLHPVWHSTRLATGALLGLPFGGAIGALISGKLPSGSQPSEPPRGA